MKFRKMPAFHLGEKLANRYLVGLPEKWFRNHPEFKPHFSSSHKEEKNHIIYFPETENRLHEVQQQLGHLLGYRDDKIILENIETRAKQSNNLIVIYNLDENPCCIEFPDGHNPALVPCYIRVRSR
jgi:hypothetical protein